jgi:hypothetical protein
LKAPHVAVPSLPRALSPRLRPIWHARASPFGLCAGFLAEQRAPCSSTSSRSAPRPVASRPQPNSAPGSRPSHGSRVPFLRFWVPITEAEATPTTDRPFPQRGPTGLHRTRFGKMKKIPAIEIKFLLHLSLWTGPDFRKEISKREDLDRKIKLIFCLSLSNLL